MDQVWAGVVRTASKPVQRQMRLGERIQGRSLVVSSPLLVVFVLADDWISAPAHSRIGADSHRSVSHFTLRGFFPDCEYVD